MRADRRGHQSHFTYAQFHLRASRFAEFLRDEWRVRPGERIALLANNSSDYFEILWGCAKAGVILVCLNWRLAVPELELMMRDSTPVALIYDPPFATSAAALRERLGLDRMMTLAAPGAGARGRMGLRDRAGARFRSSRS